MDEKYINIPNMFEVKGEPPEVTEIRAKILDKFKDLVFEEGPHIYHLNGKTLPSVTTVLGKYMQPFDQETIAKNYAEKHGETPEYWIKEWKFNNLVATTTGSLVHEFAESCAYCKNNLPNLITESCKSKYFKDKNWLIPTRNKEKAVLKFWNDIPSEYHFVLAEAKIFTNSNPLMLLKQQIAGTFDLLMYYKCKQDDSKNGLIIFDYKTNGSLKNNYNRENHKMMLPPFSFMVDESLSEYKAQLSTYQIPLEDIGLKIIGRRIIWLKDDGSYEKIPLENISKIIRKNL